MLTREEPTLYLLTIDWLSSEVFSVTLQQPLRSRTSQVSVPGVFSSGTGRIGQLANPQVNAPVLFSCGTGFGSGGVIECGVAKWSTLEVLRGLITWRDGRRILPADRRRQRPISGESFGVIDTLSHLLGCVSR
jgi:hypothetical protein